VIKHSSRKQSSHHFLVLQSKLQGHEFRHAATGPSGYSHCSHQGAAEQE